MINEKLGARQVLEPKTKKKFTCPRWGRWWMNGM
jgi:hypothetical protein